MIRHATIARCCLVALGIAARPLGQGATPSELDDVRALLAAGRFDQAEVSARAAVDRLRASGFGDSAATDAASDVLVSALIANGRGALDGTAALALETLRRRESRAGSDAVTLLPALVNAGDALEAATQYELAAVIAQRAVALTEPTSGSGSLDLATALESLGRAHAGAGRYSEALASLERSLKIREQYVPPGDVAIARTLEDIGVTLQRQGNYDGAGPALRRAAAIQEAASVTHPAYARTLGLLADQMWFEGNLLDSRSTAVRALAVAESALRPDHPTVAVSLRDLGATLADVGDLETSLELKTRALAIAERSFGPTHHVTAEYLNGLGVAELRHGDYPAAQRHLTEALAIFERRYGPNHQLVATALTVLAVIDVRLGDFVASRRALARAVAIHSKAGGRDHPFVALALTELATVLNEEARPSEALPLLQRALAIREKNLGSDHRDVARTLADRAAALAALGRVTLAQALAMRVLRIWERLDTPDAPEFATALALYADLQARRGDNAAAREYYERALAIRAKVFGPAHPLHAEAQTGLAAALAALGDSTGALSTASLAETSGRDHLYLMLRSLPERQALHYAAARPRGLNVIFSLAASTSDAVPVAVDGLIRSRALVLDEIAARHSAEQAAGRADPARAAMSSAQQRLANLLVRGPGQISPAQYTTLVDGARRESEVSEQALAERSAQFRIERSRADIGTDEVLASLPADGALVSFARYDRTIFTEPAQTPLPKAPVRASRPVSSYLAFVLRADRPPAVVPLGSVQAIDTLVSQWRVDITAEALVAPTPGELVRSSRGSGAALRRRVWDRLAEHLGDARRVFIVPDGALSLVPFAALPVGQRSYLLEAGPVIHYLSAERDLVPLPQTPGASRGLLAVGGPSFNDRTLFRARARPAPTAAASIPPTMLRGAPRPCGGLESITFPPLAGTRQEVRDLSGVWDANVSAETASVLLGRDANEASFKRDAPGHRVLHLATHGFFLNGDCAPAPSGGRGVGGLSTARVPGPAENPLLLSGLALAGANRRASAGPDEDDGILTAEEVASLNLEGVEWAVLSACDTGVGEIRAGEGVFGLRRAFQVAGARTVVMSLWSVDDQATRAWMRALYEGRFERKLSTADAVHAASLGLLRERRAKGQSTHPFYWAAFVAAGDWR